MIYDAQSLYHYPNVLGSLLLHEQSFLPCFHFHHVPWIGALLLQNYSFNSWRGSARLPPNVCNVLVKATCAPSFRTISILALSYYAFGAFIEQHSSHFLESVPRAACGKKKQTINRPRPPGRQTPWNAVGTQIHGPSGLPSAHVRLANESPARAVPWEFDWSNPPPSMRSHYVGPAMSGISSHVDKEWIRAICLTLSFERLNHSAPGAFML